MTRSLSKVRCLFPKCSQIVTRNTSPRLFQKKIIPHLFQESHSKVGNNHLEWCRNKLSNPTSMNRILSQIFKVILTLTHHQEISKLVLKNLQKSWETMTFSDSKQLIQKMKNKIHLHLSFQAILQLMPNRVQTKILPIQILTSQLETKPPRKEILYKTLK